MPLFLSRRVTWVRALLLHCANSSLPKLPVAKLQNTSWHFSDLSLRLKVMSCCKPAAHFSFWRLPMFFSAGCPFAEQRRKAINATSHAREHMVFYHQIEKNHQGPVANFEVFPANLRPWSCKHDLNVPKWKIRDRNTLNEHGWKDTAGSHLRSSEAAVNLQALKAWQWLLHDYYP